MKKQYRILSLGAGVQSTVLYLWACDGEIDIDAAVFANTGDEPKYVYEHLAWLQSQDGPRIHVVGKKVSLSENLRRGLNSTGQRFVSIPAFTTGSSHGQTRRQCTSEFKMDVIKRCIRQDICGLVPGHSVPKTTTITQLIGFSLDEQARAWRAKQQDKPSNWLLEFPLIDKGWTRSRCESYLNNRVPHDVHRSACVFCPYRSQAEWLELKGLDADGWNKAVDVDKALREEAAVCNRGVVDGMFVHAKRIPLPQAVDDKQQTMPFFFRDCTGCCGT